MIVCVCNAITTKTIEDIIEKKELKTIKQLQQEMPICNQCKCCSYAIKELLQNSQKETIIANPM